MKTKSLVSPDYAAFLTALKGRIVSARIYYLPATAQLGWSRNVLPNQIKARAYKRAVTEKRAHNFPAVLAEYLAERTEGAV